VVSGKYLLADFPGSPSAPTTTATPSTTEPAGVVDPHPRCHPQHHRLHPGRAGGPVVPSLSGHERIGAAACELVEGIDRVERAEDAAVVVIAGPDGLAELPGAVAAEGERVQHQRLRGVQGQLGGALCNSDVDLEADAVLARQLLHRG